MGTMLSGAVRSEIYRLAFAGRSVRDIASQVGASASGVGVVVKRIGGTIRPWQIAITPSRGLSFDQRELIYDGLREGKSYREIGRVIGRHSSSVCREVTANGGHGHYRPIRGHRRAIQVVYRPKQSKLDKNPALAARVEADLRALYSPQQIAGRLAREFGKGSDMSISHETIYKSLYVQSRGTLRRELAACLRTGRAARKHRDGRTQRRGRIPGMVMIADRPAEIEDRAVPGHWEGDLIIGSRSASAIGTLVERTTRFVILLHLPHDHGALAVRTAMTDAITRLPEHLRRSVTWDQGSEMTQHAQFSIETGIDIYFCDPHSPWQRGTNENTNGLLRQYFPKSTDLSVHTQAVLDAVADALNRRPRRTLQYATPAEALTLLLR